MHSDIRRIIIRHKKALDLRSLLHKNSTHKSNNLHQEEQSRDAHVLNRGLCYVDVDRSWKAL